MVPRALSLDSCLERSPAEHGLHISRLAPLQNVQVRTQNNPYSIYVLDPGEGRILVRGGQYFPDYKEAHLRGSTWGGSMLRMGWIGLGMRLEIFFDGKCIVTTPLKFLAVEDIPPRPVS